MHTTFSTWELHILVSGYVAVFSQRQYAEQIAQRAEKSAQKNLGKCNQNKKPVWFSFRLWAKFVLKEFLNWPELEYPESEHCCVVQQKLMYLLIYKPIWPYAAVFMSEVEVPKLCKKQMLLNVHTYTATYWLLVFFLIRCNS